MRTHLQADLDTALVADGTLSELGEQVGDVVPRMPVEASAQALLVEEVGNQTNAAAEHEKTVEHTHLEVVLGLLGAEGARVAEQIDEADGDATVDVQDQVVLLRRRHGLDSERVVEQLGGREGLLAVLLDEGDTEIGVVAGLNTVANTRDCKQVSFNLSKVFGSQLTELVLLAHGVNKVTGRETFVEGTGELLSSAVQGTTETRTDGQQTGDESRDEILASTGSDDSVHGTGHSGTVVSRKHEHHLQELASVVGKAATEPQQRHDTTDTDVLFEDV